MRKAIPIQLGWRIVAYWPWLLQGNRQVGLGRQPDHHRSAPADQPDPGARSSRARRPTVGLVIHANSITLTPGTITIEARPGRIPGPRADARRRRGRGRRRHGPPRHRLRGGRMMFAAAALALLVTLALALVRAALGPTVFDRVAGRQHRRHRGAADPAGRARLSRPGGRSSSISRSSTACST